jgi:hypothetical protein
MPLERQHETMPMLDVCCVLGAHSNFGVTSGMSGILLVGGARRGIRSSMFYDDPIWLLLVETTSLVSSLPHDRGHAVPQSAGNAPPALAKETASALAKETASALVKELASALVKEAASVLAKEAASAPAKSSEPAAVDTIERVAATRPLFRTASTFKPFKAPTFKPVAIPPVVSRFQRLL